KTGVRVRNLECRAGQCSLRLIAKFFKTANPILPRMLRLLLIRRPQLRDVTFDGLAFEGFALGRPAGEGARLEIEVERFAVGADGDDAGVVERFVEGVGGGLFLGRGERNEQKATKETKGGEGECSTHGCGFR